MELCWGGLTGGDQHPWGLGGPAGSAWMSGKATVREVLQNSATKCPQWWDDAGAHTSCPLHAPYAPSPPHAVCTQDAEPVMDV